jgi:phosphocarrier protein HPr
MIAKEIIVKSRTGLESKMATKFIQKVSGYKSNIWIEKGERKANAKSLLGLLSLGIANGMRVILITEGEDEQKAARELEEYMQLDLDSEEPV